MHTCTSGIRCAFPYLIKLVKLSVFGIAMGLSSFCAVELNLFSPMVRTSGAVSIMFFFTQGWISPHAPHRKPESQSKDSVKKNDSKASWILVLFLQENDNVIDNEVDHDHDVIDDPDINDNDDDPYVIGDYDDHDVNDINNDPYLMLSITMMIMMLLTMMIRSSWCYWR